jgi:hypothetical protein
MTEQTKPTTKNIRMLYGVSLDARSFSISTMRPTNRFNAHFRNYPTRRHDRALRLDVRRVG